MKKRILSLIIIISVISLSTPFAFAESGIPESDVSLGLESDDSENDFMDNEQHENAVQDSRKTADELHDTSSAETGQEQSENTSSDQSVEESELSLKVVNEEINITELEEIDGNKLKPESSSLAPSKSLDLDMPSDKVNSIQASSAATRSNNDNPAVGEYVFTLTDTGDYAMLSIDLEPGEAVFATLECPTNPDLDYDMALYDYSTGQNVDYSVSTTFMNTVRGVTKTVDEGVMAVNNYASTNTYVIEVFSSLGGSETDTCKLIVNVSDTFDPYESNENVWHTGSIGYGNIAHFPNTIDVSNDHDWFIFQTPAVLDYAAYQVWTNNANLDLYEYNDDSLIYVTEMLSGFEKVKPNTIYAVCITGPVGEYDYNSYPQHAIPAKISLMLKSSLGENVGAQYQQGLKSVFSVPVQGRVFVSTANGYAIGEAMNIDIDWKSGYDSSRTGWNRPYDYNPQTGWTNYVEIFHVQRGVGQYSSQVSGATHYYDLDTIKVTVETRTQTKSETWQVYNFAYAV